MKARHGIAIALITLLPALALAHPGHEFRQGFAAGVAHPLSGLDHLAAMLAVGMWAAQLGGRSRWAVPASFVALMLVGAVLGVSGMSVGMAEQGIAASVCVFGLLLASAVRLPALVCVLLAGGFAIFHGYSHGVEAPLSATVIAYIGGFVFSTIMLHAAGYFAGSWLLHHRQRAVLRWTGAAMVVGGLVLAVA